MILLIDNYDSFTYNIVQYIGELGYTPLVYRNDKISVEDVEKIKFEKLIISPGPCTPREAGISVELIRKMSGKKPILGVCLGHQCIGEAFGGKIVRADKLMHGKTSMIYHNGKDIFENVENPFIATRYHSLVIGKDSVPDCLDITAVTKEKEIMAVKHRKFPVWGVQFHPESVLTKEGKKIINNFLKL
ncbi:aminodeoxychorismate/anthranilate synthase component II [bacterium]|jgi:anthranilate/para-aminobenzoate synthase component II|nr:aminodeoxychorismate/anthranilate synthase component II [bacterium]